MSLFPKSKLAVDSEQKNLDFVPKIGRKTSRLVIASKIGIESGIHVVCHRIVIEIGFVISWLEQVDGRCLEKSFT